MSEIQRILICIAGTRDAARAALADITNQNTSGSFVAELSADGSAPATYYAMSQPQNPARSADITEVAAADLETIDEEHPWVANLVVDGVPETYAAMQARFGLMPVDDEG